MVTSPSRTTIAILFALLIGFALVPFSGDSYLIRLATRILIFAIFAMSLDLLLGYTGLVSFGHAAFFGLAAYTLQLYSPEYDAVDLWTALPVALGVTALAATIIGALVVRTSGIYFIMVTLAFAQMLFFFFHDSQIAGGSDGAYIWVKPVLPVGDANLIDFDNRSHLYFFTMGALIFCYALLIVVLRSPFGQVIQGIKLNEHRMKALGYNTYFYKLVSFVISATITGLAGFLFACIDGFVAPQILGWQESGIGLMMVILGGIGTLYGALFGALAYIGMEEIFQDDAIFGLLTDHWHIMMGLFVIFVVLFLDNGLAGLAKPLRKLIAKGPSKKTPSKKEAAE